MENEYSKYTAYYTTPEELDAWICGIHADAEKADFKAEMQGGFTPASFGQFHNPGCLMKFERDGHVFYGIWHGKYATNGATASPAPLLVQLPGYGAELSSHWDVASRGYNLLQLSPLGYWTPEGFNESLKPSPENTPLPGSDWPVLPDTLRTEAKGGYREWLLDVVTAVRWAWEQSLVLPNRVSFYGTSQGGGTSLLLGSIFAGRGTACVCADEPFLTNYPLAAFRGAYGIAKGGYEETVAAKGEAAAWHAFGMIDTLCHAHRMNYPVLLTAGGCDPICPADTVESLYAKLPKTRSLTYLHNHWHGYNLDFIKLACAWFELYA